MCCMESWFPRVSNYKYLGCVVGEHLELREVLKKKTAAGKKALGDGWAVYSRGRRCGFTGLQEVNECSGGVDNAVQCWNLGLYYKPESNSASLQLCAFHIFFGVGTLHPKVSLIMEMETLPLLRFVHTSQMVHIFYRCFGSLQLPSSVIAVQSTLTNK